MILYVAFAVYSRCSTNPMYKIVWIVGWVQLKDVFYVSEVYSPRDHIRRQQYTPSRFLIFLWFHERSDDLITFLRFQLTVNSFDFEFL
jgi:hypothetical protein